MATSVYDPKELLDTLLKIEYELQEAMEKYCHDSRFSIDVDVEKTLEAFLSRQGVKGNEVGFLSTQIALLHLRREVEKSRDVVVDTNDLRAWEEYTRYSDHEENRGEIKQRNGTDTALGTKLNYVMLVITLTSVMLTGYFFLFYSLA
ncbi:hypothetical protein [Sphingobacterium arenae]|uniref:Uncharacterized protein n=1 Tax=Sphingobacterium arenae TaxID=1280598 RepID=A0ABR7Y5I2_9SPHI|nr:hypothetical protein [Sphingobacterium arenae]MBD1426575.1 hypothetical protein [Sphingobacterium arenae]